MSEFVLYICCDSCGCEKHHTFCQYLRTTASGDIYLCPVCDAESLNVIKQEVL